MVQSVELVLDDATDAAVRSQWQQLSDAGLPSQGRHTGASNRPHVTLAARSDVPGGLDGPLAGAVGPLPMPLVLGGLVCFGGRRAVLARLVVPTDGLLRAHRLVAAVLDSAGAAPSPGSHLDEGRWTPHVTLARGLAGEQLAAAVLLLAATSSDLVGAAASVRRWDGDARRTWDLPPPP